jgi:hypothetical protein
VGGEAYCGGRSHPPPDADPGGAERCEHGWKRLNVHVRVLETDDVIVATPPDPSSQAQTRAGHEQRRGFPERGHEIECGPLDHCQRDIASVVRGVSPNREGKMIAAELVAEAAAGPLGVDMLACEQRIDHLRAHRGDSGSPAWRSSRRSWPGWLRSTAGCGFAIRSRSAVYRAAAPADRRRVHRARAKTTDMQIDPDRRAWHLAEAVAGPDEDVAAELERAAGRAQAWGGLTAAAAFQERAVGLTSDPSLRAQRSLAAVLTQYEAGALDDALALLGIAAAGANSKRQRARVDLLRAQIAFSSRRAATLPRFCSRPRANSNELTLVTMISLVTPTTPYRPVTSSSARVAL